MPTPRRPAAKKSSRRSSPGAALAGRAAVADREVSTLFSLRGIGMAQADPDTRRILRVNDSLCRLTGYSESELLAMTVDELNHPDDRDADAAQFRRLVQEGGDYEIEKRYLRKDGTSVWVRVTGNVVRDAKGRAVRVFAIAEDVTARKRAEGQLRESEASQRFLLEFSDALRTVRDASELQRIASGLLGRHLHVAGVHYSEMREDDDLCIVGPDYHARHFHSLAGTYRLADFGETMPALRGGRPVAIDDVETTPLLSEKPRATYRSLGIRALVAAPLVRDGRLVWALAVLCTRPRAWTPAEVALVQECGERTWGDVQRVVAEAALRQSHLALEARVVERTRELEAMRREAERANATKSRFLAAASHDLRQPLQTMHIAIELLGRSMREPAAALPLQKLAAAARAMDELLSTLLDVDRLEQGALVPHVVDFRLQPLLARLRSELGWTADAKQIRLAIDDCDEVVHSDPALLDVMLRNLVGNAIKFTAHGGVHVSFVADGDALRIDVRDTGVGIASEHLGHVFDEYFQAPGAKDACRPGVGLGLAIVQQIGRALGHEVTVQSAVGVGTTFSLKVARGAGRPEEHVVTPPAGSGALPLRGEGRRVLHVEDDPGIAESLGMLLALEGYAVTSARSAAEALAALEHAPPPDVIVTDYQLPEGVTGLHLLREIVNRPPPHPPTILMSGDISERLAAEGSRLADRILRKPVEGAALLREIGTLLNREVE